MSGPVYYGHADYYGEDGTDILVSVWPDGGVEVALRPGRRESWVTWGPPVECTDGPAEVGAG